MLTICLKNTEGVIWAVFSFFVILHENKTIYIIMRRRNFEGDYNLLFEKQSKYEESIKSYHEHNKAAKGPVLVNKLKEGMNIALVSDAGMPCIGA